MTDETNDAAARIAEIAERHGLTIGCTFVPFEHSRNAKPAPGAKEPWRSLNWRVDLKRNGVTIYESDYSQGTGHCPAMKAKAPYFLGKAGISKPMRERAVDIEINTGRVARFERPHGEPRASRTPIAPPSIVDILSSLALDASAIDFPTFEDWAEDYGYSADSISARETYRACLAAALILRSALGDDGLAELREWASEL